MKMRVGIDEAGNHRAPLQVDPARRRPGEGQDFRVPSYFENLAIAHRLPSLYSPTLDSFQASTAMRFIRSSSRSRQPVAHTETLAPLANLWARVFGARNDARPGSTASNVS